MKEKMLASFVEARVDAIGSKANLNIKAGEKWGFYVRSCREQSKSYSRFHDATLVYLSLSDAAGRMLKLV